MFGCTEAYSFQFSCRIFTKPLSLKNSRGVVGDAGLLNLKHLISTEPFDVVHHSLCFINNEWVEEGERERNSGESETIQWPENEK